MVDKVRELVLKTIYKIDIENAYSNLILDETIKQNKNNLSDNDIGFLSQIVYGVTTWRLTLDAIVEKYSKIKIKKISPWIINILRMSIYQIVFLDKVPKSAAVNEGVNLAKRYGHKSSAGFVNAILRKVTKEDYEELFNIKNLKEKISKTTSTPEWIIDELRKEGMEYEQIESVCNNSNIKPNISIRINNLKISKDDLISKLEEKNIKVKKGILKDFLIIDKARNIENIKEFKEGYFTVQDEVAGLPSLVLEPKKGEVILDACSSPGGKTTYIAQIVEDNATIEAWDIHKNRAKLVEENANRLGLYSIKTLVKDATMYYEEYYEKFDKILLDVPCLGLGVLKRKPDIKWQRKREDIEIISSIQYEILSTCSKYLKPGGEMVYSTCSILNKENKNLVMNFVNNNKQFKIQEIKTSQYENNNIKFFEKYIIDKKFLQVYPNKNTDGFFICKILKK